MNKELITTQKIKNSLAGQGILNTGEPLLNKINNALVDLQVSLAKKNKPFSFAKNSLQLATDASRIINAGLNLKDHDLIYTIARGDVITLCTHYDATLRVAKRRGYIIIPTFYPVFKGETLEFNEDYGHYSIKVNEGDRFSRTIKVDDIINNNLLGCGIKIEVKKIMKDGSITPITERFERLDLEDIMKIQSSSSAGLYEQEWKKLPNGKSFKGFKEDNQGNKVINKLSFWYLWTNQMVYKTCLRKGLSYIKESLPEFKEVYDFIDAEFIEDEKENATFESKANNPKEIVVEEVIEEIDFKNPPEDMIKERDDLIQLFSSNDALAEQWEEDISVIAKEVDKEDFIALNKFKKEKGAYILALHKLGKANKILEAMK